MVERVEPVQSARLGSSQRPPRTLPTRADADPETFDVSTLPPSVLEALEADSFWCLSKLLDGIQDNYIFAQPGIQRLVKKMDGLCARVDGALLFLWLAQPAGPGVSERQGRPVLGWLGGVRAGADTATRSRSPARGAPQGARRRVHPVCVPVDELPPHARAQRQEHCPHVGHIPRAWRSLSPSRARRTSVADAAGLRDTGRGRRRLLRVPPVRVLGVPGAVERHAARDGLPGACSALSLVESDPSAPEKGLTRCRFASRPRAHTVDHHFPAVAADAGLDRQGHGAVAQRGLPVEPDLPGAVTPALL